MIKKIAGEEWKQLLFPGHKNLRKKYAVSSHGRMASYHESVLEDGKLLSGSYTTGYRTLNLHRPDNNGTLYLHREVAKAFLKKPTAKQKYVIHLNHVKTDNQAKNLAWATQEEMISHQQNSPAKLAYKEVQANRKKGLKLSISQVKAIKKITESSKRNLTIKQIADKYSVSEMTIYRIKSGENWGRV